MSKAMKGLGRFFARIGRAIAGGFRRFLQALRQPKWRHGGFGALLLAAFVAVCVLLNLMVDSLETDYGWRLDFSFNGYATTGEVTKKTLDTLSHDVKLYLLYQGGDMDSQLYSVLERYRLLSDRVSIEAADITRNPGLLTRFQGDATTAAESGSVIVSCEDTGRYLILSGADFVTQGYNIEQGTFEIAGLAYEKKLTEAIVYVTADDTPVIGLLQGHGELDEDTLTNLLELLKSNGYDWRSVNLLAADALEGVDLLLIADPQKDFSDDEIQQVKAFAENGGSLFVMRDYSDPLQMPNYMSLLKSYGVVPLAGVAVAGENDTGSYYGERIYLLPYLCAMDMTQPLIDGNMDILLLAGASAFETPTQTDNSLSAAAVLKTGPNAYLRDLSDGHTTIDRQPDDPTGELTLAILSGRMHANGNVSRMFAIGNSTVFTDEYVYQRGYSEEFLIQLLGELLPQKTISLDIMATSAIHPGLKASSQSFGLMLLAAVPLLVLLCGICVLVPRRNR